MSARRTTEPTPLGPGRRHLPKREIIERAIAWYGQGGSPRRSKCKTIERRPTANGYKAKLVTLRWKSRPDEVHVIVAMTNDEIGFALEVVG